MITPCRSLTNTSRIKYSLQMKVWIKILAGSILGIVLGVLLPHNDPNVTSALIWLEALALRLGQYILAPLLFFSLAISIFELRKDDRMWPIIFKTMGIILGSALLLTGIGLLVVNIFPPGRVPILKEGMKEAITLDVSQSILDLFPENAFSALFGSGAWLAPISVFAFFLGAGLSYEKTHAKTITNLVDSLARVFYYVSAFFSELLGILMIALAAYWAVEFREALKLEVFHDILILFGLTSAITAFLVMPLCLYLFGPKTNPWKPLYGSIGPAITALFSGNYNFCIPVLFRHAKENHGVRRRVNTLSITLFSLFARAGSTMIAVMALFIILRSYSSLALEVGDIIGIGLTTIGISLVLSRHPGTGAYTALAVLCAWYGRDYEAGYLILKPIAFYLAAMGTLIDVVFASLGTWAIGKLEGAQEEKEVIHYI